MTETDTGSGADIAFGYHALAIPPAAVAAVAERVEELGIDQFWLAETKHDPFVGLAVAASHTRKVAIHTGLAVAFARNPMSVAMAANDLQLLSEGRFVLGLGSQMKGHITRRFGMPWSQPAARMREFVLAVRAVWRSFETGRLRFRGEFYRHTMMDTFFNPGPNPFGDPQILVAGVGERMTEVAGEVADGYLAHAIATPRFLQTTALPLLARGRAASGKTLEGFRLHVSPMVVSGTTEEEVTASAAAARAQIAKYLAVPTYGKLVASEGVEALRDELQVLAAQGRWDEMPGLIDETVLAQFAVVAEPHEIGARLLERYGHLVGSMSIYLYGYRDPDELVPLYRQLQDGRAHRRRDAAVPAPVG